MQTSSSKLHSLNGHFPDGLLSPQALFSGVMVALWLSTLFNFLGLGWGFTTLKLDADTLATLGGGSILWLTVSGALAMLSGGWVAGWLAPGPSETARLSATGALGGVVVCAVSMLATLLLAMTAAGSALSNTAPLIAKGLSAVGSGLQSSGKAAAKWAPQIAEQIQDNGPEWASGIWQLQQTAEKAATRARRETSGEAPQSAEDAKARLRKGISRFFDSMGAEHRHDNARRELIDLLKNNTDMDAKKAERTVDNWQQEAERLKDRLQEQAGKAKRTVQRTTERASHAAGKASFMAFLILAFATAAGAVGGALGARARQSA